MDINDKNKKLCLEIIEEHRANKTALGKAEDDTIAVVVFSQAFQLISRAMDLLKTGKMVCEVLKIEDPEEIRYQVDTVLPRMRSDAEQIIDLLKKLDADHRALNARYEHLPVEE